MPRQKDQKRIIQLLLEEHLSFAGPNLVTDFKAILIATKHLNLSPQGYNVVYRADDEDTPTPGARKFKIRLVLTGTFAIKDLVDYMASNNPNAVFSNKEAVIQGINILIGHNLRAAAQIISSGSSRYFNWQAAYSDRTRLVTSLFAIRGFFVSARPAISRLLVNVQVKHAPFYEPGRLEELMRKFFHDNGPNKGRLAKCLEHLSVNITHIVRKSSNGQQIKRMKSIWGLGTLRDGRTPGRNQLHPPIIRSFGAGLKEVQFWMDSSQKYTTVFDHFLQTYDITITDVTLPVINVGNRDNPMYLPAQVCQIEQGERFKSELLPSQTKQMINFAVRKPTLNANSLVKEAAALLKIHQSTNPTYETFGIGLDSRLVAVHGRIFPCPKVTYHGNQTAATSNGQWNMIKIQFADSKSLSSWTWVVVDTADDFDPWRGHGYQQTLDNFANELRKVCIACGPAVPGLRITVRPTTPANSTRPLIPEDVESKIGEAFKKFAITPNRQPPDLVLVVLLNDKTDIYNQIKLTCDIGLGLTDVCVLASKFAKAQAQYFANVALKVNLKLGGRNQALEPAKFGLLSQMRTMVVGLDVTHPSTGSSKDAPSVVDIVASVDKYFTQYPGAIRVQESRKEMITALTELMKKRLTLWRKRNNGAYPGKAHRHLTL